MGTKAYMVTLVTKGRYSVRVMAGNPGEAADIAKAGGTDGYHSWGFDDDSPSVDGVDLAFWECNNCGSWLKNAGDAVCRECSAEEL